MTNPEPIDTVNLDRNLAHSPACTLTARLPGIDVVFTGEASSTPRWRQFRTRVRAI